MLLKIMTVLLCIFSGHALALPEAARHGHLTCVSCHVSPGGGGLLTPYGRDFSAEKLSTWSTASEAETFHGIVQSPDALLAGGDARWVHYEGKTKDKTFKKFWRMQTDLEVGAHVGSFYVTHTFGTKPAGPMDQNKNGDHLLHRGYMARADFWDERLIVRAGLFMPKYGLMLADHTAFVRVLPGLRPDGEQTQVEISYQDDDGDLEITAAQLFESDLYDRRGKTKSGVNLGVNLLLARKNRLGMGFLATNQSDGAVRSVTRSLGVSGVWAPTSEIFALAESTRVQSIKTVSGTASQKESHANYLSAHLEVIRGLIPYFKYEYYDSDLTRPDTVSMRWGPGLMWYPRPHFQFEARASKLITIASRASTTQSEALIHYYF